jgi:4-amino-4-deoxy-L-arabinose transferase-like glycosyltransferase
MSRLPSAILVLAVWAAIYLPALGSFEIKGEEGRRILPAIAMLDTGNYIVPSVGGDAYFSKPPLVNWLVAASFRLFGRSEWTARLPSVLAILVVALGFITVGKVGLGPRAATIAALVWLTTFGLIEKGRLIEIEAVYVSLCALAIIFWVSWWLGKRSPWLIWTVPWIWLGLGWLAKGPVHLIFFYAVVVAVLWRLKQIKALRHPAHFVGIALMLGIFASWAVPFLQISGGGRALTKWSAQFTGRVTPHFFTAGSALGTLGRAIGQFAPWLIFVPLLRFPKFAEMEDNRVAQAMSWSAIVPLLVVSVLPVSAARYSLPVAAPFCWLMGLAFGRDAFVSVPWLVGRYRTVWHRIGQPIVLIVAVGAAVIFPLLARRSNQHEKVRPIAAVINAQVPPAEILYLVDVGYQPFLFYLHAPVKYLDRLDQIPQGARFLVVRKAREAEVSGEGPLSRQHPVLVSTMPDYRGETVLLFRLGGES